MGDGLPVFTLETIYHVRTETRQSLVIYLSCIGRSINLHPEYQCISVTFDDQYYILDQRFQRHIAIFFGE